VFIYQTQTTNTVGDSWRATQLFIQAVYTSQRICVVNGQRKHYILLQVRGTRRAIALIVKHRSKIDHRVGDKNLLSLLPIIDYADTCYLDLTEEQLNKLEGLQNISIRFIFGLRKYDHISHFRAKLKWLAIRLSRNAHIVSLLYNILFNPKYPSYLREHFKLLDAIPEC
jgi:hypothetical protein